MLGFRILFLGVIGLFKKFPSAIAVSLLPALTSYLCFQILAWMAPIQASLQGSFWYTFIGFFFCTIPPLAWAWSSWSRVAILQERPRIYPRLENWTWISVTFRLAILTTLYVTFFAMIFGVVDYIFSEIVRNTATEIPGVLGVFAFVLLGYIFGTWVLVRLALCVPAISISDPVNFRKSWRQTADYTPTIIVISLSLLTMYVVFFIIFAATISGPFVFWGTVMEFIWIFVFWLLTAIIVAVLTELYSYIRAQNDVRQVFE